MSHFPQLVLRFGSLRSGAVYFGRQVVQTCNCRLCRLRRSTVSLWRASFARPSRRSSSSAADSASTCETGSSCQHAGADQLGAGLPDACIVPQSIKKALLHMSSEHHSPDLNIVLWYTK